MELIKIILTYVLILLVVAIFFDVIMFFFLPNDYAFNFNGYRDRFLDQTFSTPTGEPYIRDYYVKHEERGFDIGKNKQGYHRVNQITYPIWSNSIGCFDKEHTQYAQYVYLTGDSYAWGYTPYNEKFGTIIEDLTGTQVLKCGISHTGQQQQYDKFIEIERKIGILPKAIIVFYFANDISNDYAYPHSTVIDGHLVDNIEVDKDGNLIKTSEQELRESVVTKLHDPSLQGPKYYSLGIRNAWGQKIIHFLRQYSLSAQLVISVTRRTESFMEKTDSANEPAVKSIYFLDGFNGHVAMVRKGQYWYSDNPYAIPNKKAIAAFKKFSTENGILLVMVLIPPPVKSDYANTKFYEQLRNFLTDNEIRFVDLTFFFHKNQLPLTDLYWRYDGHFSPSGNKTVADILIKELPEVFSGTEVNESLNVHTAFSKRNLQRGGKQIR